MKKTLFFLLLAAFFLLGCNKSSSPGQVLNDFYIAANDGQYEKAESLLSVDVKNSYEQWGLSIKEGMNDITRNGTIAKIDVLEETVKNERGDVTFEIIYTDGTSEEATVSMYNEKGKWKVGLRK